MSVLYFSPVNLLCFFAIHFPSVSRFMSLLFPVYFLFFPGIISAFFPDIFPYVSRFIFLFFPGFISLFVLGSFPNFFPEDSPGAGEDISNHCCIGDSPKREDGEESESDDEV